MPKTGRANKPIGNTTREKLNQIYGEFLDAYFDMITDTETFLPSIFFIFSENDHVEEEPISFPLNIDLLKNPAFINHIFDAITKSHPIEKFTLEMILYAQKGRNEVDGTDIVIFGARDLGGNTVHTAMGQNETNKHPRLEIKKIGDTALHEWLPPSTGNRNDIVPINDDFLNMLIQKYMIACSINNIFSK